MRKQYHFRKSPDGYFAWDVHKLVELAKNIAPHRVPLSRIAEADENYWFASQDDEPTCRRIVEHMKLVEKADLDFPIILCADGRLMDGMHRVAKALLQDKDTIEVVRFSETPEPDFEDVMPDDLPC